ncbi:polyprenyl synthetase family protein [Natroniella sulfidigena]|uniref:polyprenyl synthetase family protein n=1 Tax=Natroniella sulfidigena TaxID=723921 RepID=UPI00200AF50E|nr:polyprenyl synthetase family protein [Natroniella sulfidigena]
MVTTESKFKALIDQVDEFIIEYANSRQELINVAVTDLVKAGGKRLRPILMILASEFGDDQSEKKIKIASGLELLHMATLVHDDIIDEASTRRGELTTQNKFGKDVAVFVGDFLLTKAYNLFLEHLSRKAALKFNQTVKLICEGEVDQYESKFDPDLTINGYLRRIRRKTALLFAFSTYVGAYESGIRNTTLSNLYNLGLEMGMAFQIRDDILDFVGEKRKVGKAVGQDLLAGIYTLPIVYLLESKESNKQVKEILTKESITEDDAILISELVKNTGALAKSQQLEERFLDRAKYHLAQLPGNEAKQHLNYILGYQVSREK